MYPIKISFGKKCPTIVITVADPSSCSTTCTTSTEVETTNKQLKVNKDESKYTLSEEEKENLNKGSLIRNNSLKYFIEDIEYKK